eukprot:SAG11_NODE_419_length_9648_cov_6.815478_4_plen_190_part_00
MTTQLTQRSWPNAAAQLEDSKFLETDVMVLHGYHLCVVHRTPDMAAMLSDLESQNFRIVPSTMFATPESLMGYIINVLARVEANCTFRGHMVFAMLEVLLEFPLHSWPFDVIMGALCNSVPTRLPGTGMIDALPWATCSLLISNLSNSDLLPLMHSMRTHLGLDGIPPCHNPSYDALGLKPALGRSAMC